MAARRLGPRTYLPTPCWYSEPPAAVMLPTYPDPRVQNSGQKFDRLAPDGANDSALGIDKTFAPPSRKFSFELSRLRPANFRKVSRKFVEFAGHFVSDGDREGDFCRGGPQKFSRSKARVRLSTTRVSRLRSRIHAPYSTRTMKAADSDDRGLWCPRFWWWWWRTWGDRRGGCDLRSGRRGVSHRGGRPRGCQRQE
jgi:hypothetical protein